MPQRTHSESITVSAPAQRVYDLVSDIARTGEWSPTCSRCEWDDPERTGVGATFTGYNETPSRRWQTTSTVVAADPGRRFAWEVGDGFVRWSYDLHPVDEGTELSESWTFLPAGLEHFAKQYGQESEDVIENRTRAAKDDMPRTLARIKQLAESA
ncbi:MAG: SRPBCC family protein [Ornithinimicrobium sp.]